MTRKFVFQFTEGSKFFGSMVKIRKKMEKRKDGQLFDIAVFRGY